MKCFYVLVESEAQVFTDSTFILLLHIINSHKATPSYKIVPKSCWISMWSSAQITR